VGNGQNDLIANRVVVLNSSISCKFIATLYYYTQ
jgi:hypothetical protein